MVEPCRELRSKKDVQESFKVPDPEFTGPITAQMCFILDYTGSMRTQIAQAKESVSQIVEAVQSMRIPGMPKAAIDLEP